MMVRWRERKVLWRVWRIQITVIRYRKTYGCADSIGFGSRAMNQKKPRHFEPGPNTLLEETKEDS